MDLRKPKIFNDFGLKNELGLSTYLAGQFSLPEILQPSGYNNLDVIGGGVVPPNPSELFQSPRVAELMEQLRVKFDFVILDTPPVGLVVDALQITPMLDAMLYVARYNYTNRELLAFVDNQHAKGLVENVSIILNDIGQHKGYGDGYDYGYYQYDEREQ